MPILRVVSTIIKTIITMMIIQLVLALESQIEGNHSITIYQDLEEDLHLASPTTLKQNNSNIRITITERLSCQSKIPART
jgi:hypothetical protein